MHSEMGPVWQNSIQRTVRTAHLSVLISESETWHHTISAAETDEYKGLLQLNSQVVLNQNYCLVTVQKFTLKTL